MNTKDIHEVGHFNVLAAHKIGLKVPETEVLNALTLEEAESITGSVDWEVIDDTAIKRVQGTPVTQYAWYDGKLSHNILAISSNYLLTGDQGPRLDSNIITLFPGRLESLDKNFIKLAQIVDEDDFTGFIGISVVIKDGKPYYQKIHTRVPYDLLLCYGELTGEIIGYEDIEGLSESIRNFQPRNRFACLMKVYNYPYDYTLNMTLQVPEALMGTESLVATGSGARIKDAWRDCYRKVEGIPDICYRTDGDTISGRTYNYLKKERIL